MKKSNPTCKLFIQYTVMFIITGAFGVINHFLYEWTNNNYLIGFFTPINESIFEHLKLLFFPFIVVSFIEMLILNKNIKNLIPYRIFNITLSIILLPITYYFFKAINVESGVFNILLYFIYLFLSFYLSYQNEKENLVPSKSIKTLSLLTSILLIIIFIVFTTNPPNFELFRDPLKASSSTNLEQHLLNNL